jgi:hypothetical protein
MLYAVLIAAVLLCLYFLLNKRGTLRPFMKKAIFAYLAIFLCLALLEIAMIIAEPYLSGGFFQYDPDLGFKVRAYSDGTNRFGFNDRDYELDKTEGIFRILVLGDSFGWVGGKEGNYTALLEQKFEEHYGAHRVDVVNAGYPMTHTGEQLALLEKYGLQYQPDMVLVGFFAGNDFIDADPNRKRIVVNDTQFDIDRRYEIKILGRPIVLQSRLWHFAKQRLIVWKNINKVHASDAAQSQQEASNENEGTFEDRAYLDIERYRLSFCHMPSYARGVYGKNIDYILQAFNRMKELTDSRNIQLVAGIYPDEFQVDDDLMSRVFTTFNLERDQFDPELMQRLLRERLDSLKLDYVDLLGAFREKEKEERLFLLRDTHWNAAGIELAADRLFRFLVPKTDAVLIPER